MEKGYLSLVLHAHLPYVRHPEHERFLEEDWYFESVTETYLPLLEVFERLMAEGINFRITVSLSPTLLAMFNDPLLMHRYVAHINRLVELSEKEISRTGNSEFNDLARFYHSMFSRMRELFINRYRGNLINAFRRMQDHGCIEVITCGATHGFLPLMDINYQAVKAQIQVSVEYYQQCFGRKPRGFWLPECGYHPGHDQALKEAGIQYFLVDTHGIMHGSPRPKYGIFAPVFCPSGIAAFGRDIESSKQVWSSKEGYPGDFEYRDFYRDIGYDLDYEYIKPYIASCGGSRTNTGIKYHKITGKTDHKLPYNRHAAMEKAAQHAGNFMFNRQKQVEYLYDFLKKKPIIISPYDAELFGHWWFEGPEFIEYLIRKIHYDQDTIRLATPYDYLKENPRNQIIEPSMSSWGYKGYNEVWLEGSNDWIYRHLHVIADRMVALAQRFEYAHGMLERALNQAARELLLAQSSDWAFIMKTGTMAGYAHTRIKNHINRFNRLYEQINNNCIDPGWLSDIESKDNIFPSLNYRTYRPEAVLA
ncbi:MAG: DUF1957 domain-containing protein [Elusimicrobia bacterium]|nr:DUF1957 domain-containing protein [Elusimicrobiota bacterium]MBD3411830.1 DUF1957 domain-containing protein [Elusimicrobiota bacterium]